MADAKAIRTKPAAESVMVMPLRLPNYTWSLGFCPSLKLGRVCPFILKLTRVHEKWICAELSTVSDGCYYPSMLWALL
jgi:hypothetical protein